MVKPTLEEPGMEDAWGQDVPSQLRDPHAIPRDMAPDNRKDMKRKASVPNVGKDGLHEGANQGKDFGNQNALRGIKGFSCKAPSKVPKPNHVDNHSLGWEQNKWPLSP